MSPHTIAQAIAQARDVMRETQRILDADARLPRPVNARASAETSIPPTRAESFHDVVTDHLRAGKTQAQAVRLAAIERPDLRANFVRLSNEKRELETTVAKAKATARHRRR